jgi:hypothetical protein
MEEPMRIITFAAALGLLATTGACSDWSNHDSGATYNQAGSSQAAGTTPFSNGLRTDQSQPTSCSPADSTCGTGIGNPSVQSPVQKRELNVTPQ